MKQIATGLLLLILGVIGASAQTVTKQDGVQSVTISIPGSCLAGGRADTVTLSGNVRTVISSTTINGIKTGYLVWAGTLTGTGTYGRVYTATGSYLDTFKNQDQYLDGDFTFTTNLRLTYAQISPGGVTFHDKQEFVKTNFGITLTALPDEKSCL